MKKKALLGNKVYPRCVLVSSLYPFIYRYPYIYRFIPSDISIANENKKTLNELRYVAHRWS